MSTPPDSELDLELHFLPAWAKQSPDVNRYAHYVGDTRPPREGRGRPGRFGERPGRPTREGAPGGRRPGPGGRPPADRGPRRPVPAEKPEVLPEIDVAFIPEEKGVESIARQIRFTGRAYPMFEIGQLILGKPERYNVVFSVIKRPDGQVAQALWLCNLDETLWLSVDDAIAHVLKKHFSLFYQVEKTPTDPPKGTYTFVAQCGLSGTILGPPNYHDYQTKLRKLHASRFARMPFEAYKAKIKIVRDDAVVKKWVEDQSWKTEYTCLNLPEALRLGSRDEVEKHFREVHLPNIIRQVETWTAPGTVAQQLPSPLLRQVLRVAWENQRRFPLRLVNALSQQFAGQNLQFFKVNKTITHVAVARPHYLDLEAAPVSNGIRRIVEYINANPNGTRRHLVEALAPTPAPPPPAATPPPEPPANEPGAVSGAEPAPAVAPPPPPPPEPTPEQTTVIADLHWLIHQGHVIEFANGRLDTAKKPKPKPAPPEPSPPASVEPVVDNIPPEPVAPGAAAPDTAGAGATGTEPPADEVPPSEPVAVTSSTANPPASPEGEALAPPSLSEENGVATAAEGTAPDVGSERAPIEPTGT